MLHGFIFLFLLHIMVGFFTLQIFDISVSRVYYEAYCNTVFNFGRKLPCQKQSNDLVLSQCRPVWPNTFSQKQKLAKIFYYLFQFKTGVIFYTMSVCSISSGCRCFH